MQLDGTAGQSLTEASTGGTFSIFSGFWMAVALPSTTLSVPNVTGTYGGNVSLTATLSSSGTNINNKSITFTFNGTNVGTATTDANGLATLTGVSLSGINAGTYAGAVTAQFAGDLMFAARNGAGQLMVQKATPLLQVTGGIFTYDGQPHGAASTATGVNNEALGPITLFYNGAGDIPVNAGIYSVTASFAGNQYYDSAVDNQHSIVINKANQTITFGTLSNKTFGYADFTVSASASSNLTVSFSATVNCTVTGNTVHITGAGLCTITASQTGDQNFDAATPVQQSFTINKANTTTAVAVSNATFDGQSHAGTASVSGGGGLNQNLMVTYTGRNATNYGPSTTAPTNAGEYNASATFDGDANYNGSSDSEDFQIAKADQTIIFDALSSKTFGDAPFNVSATASSGLAVSFSSQTTGVCTVSGNTLTIIAAGTCTLRASQVGDGNFNSATPVNQSFTVAKANQTITFGGLANKTFGDADFGVSATANSGLIISFSASGNCTVSGSIVNITGAGTCTITASQAGNSNYNAANDIQQMLF